MAVMQQPTDLYTSTTNPINKCCSRLPTVTSYLPVLSFNSKKYRAQSFIVSYVGYRFITAYN